MRLFACVLLLSALFFGCASMFQKIVQKDWAAEGGSKADGTVRLFYQYAWEEIPEASDEQGLQVAIERCKAWGYTKAEAFGAVTKKCQQYGPTIAGQGCLDTWVTKEYQCRN